MRRGERSESLNVIIRHLVNHMAALPPRYQISAVDIDVDLVFNSERVLTPRVEPVEEPFQLRQYDLKQHDAIIEKGIDDKLSSQNIEEAPKSLEEKASPFSRFFFNWVRIFIIFPYQKSSPLFFINYSFIRLLLLFIVEYID